QHTNHRHSSPLLPTPTLFQSLTVGALPIVDDAPLFLAIKNGYFKQQGLTVTTEIIPQSTLAVPDMLHGTVDIIGTGNYVSFFERSEEHTSELQSPCNLVCCLL